MTIFAENKWRSDMTKEELIERLDDIDPGSFDTFRRHIKLFNESYPYADAENEAFCRKTGIFARGSSELCLGGLLMLGKLDSIHRFIPNFWVDYIEIPGTSYNDAAQRYTFRMQEQENLWEYYKVIIQRFRLYTDNPFTTTPEGVSPEDDSQLYALKEGLVNFSCPFRLFQSYASDNPCLYGQD